MKNKLLVICTVALAWGPFKAQGQRFSFDAALHMADKPYVEVTGEATVSEKPDQAVVEIGVVSRGATAEIAAEQNAKQTGAVLLDLSRLLGGEQEAPNDDLFGAAKLSLSETRGTVDDHRVHRNERCGGHAR